MQKNFSCPDCKTNINGTNCSFSLCRDSGIKNIQGCYAGCQCGYPVRAKELRNNYFKKNFSKCSKDKSDNQVGYVYCENNNGQGHVYYGSFNDCRRGNGLAAQGMSSVALFEVYYD